jgi:hypothetical protein
MSSRILRLAVGFLLQVVSCSSRCPWPALDVFRQRELPVALRGVRDVVPIDRDESLVESEQVLGGGERRLALTRIRNGLEEQVAAIADVDPIAGDALTVAAGRWWYSRSYRHSESTHVLFISDDGSGAVQRRVDVARRRPILWLPLRGGPPAGVLLSVAGNLATIAADEVSPSGVTPRGSFPTIFPGSGFQPRLAAAERFRDGRIALFSIEEPLGGASRFMLRVFGAGGEVTETALPCADRIRSFLSTAIDATGRVAVVALSDAGQVVAMVVAPDDVGRSRCRVISAPGEAALSADRGSPAVVAAGDAFFAGWIRDSGRVRVCRFRSLDAAPLVIDAGDGAVPAGAMATLINAGDDESLTLTWTTDRGIAARRLPQALGGFALLSEIEQLHCDLIGKR